MSKVHVFDHPLIQHKLTIMRQTTTGPKEFRELLEEISMLMVYEVTRDLPTVDVEIETPICKTTQKMLAGKKLGIVPILRAGLASATSASPATPRPWSLWSITASCLRTQRSASCSCWTPCWPPAALPPTPSP